MQNIRMSKFDYLCNQPCKIRKLDDYRYHEYRKEVLHIIEAHESSNYIYIKGKKHRPILYKIESNQNGVQMLFDREINWYSYKPISKAKALLLW